MGEILQKSSARKGTCLYRGEPECYPIVSSGLYRACAESAYEMFDIHQLEQEIVERARDYTMLEDEDDILAEIQHFGGSTNLIDFTSDYLVALFFASAESDGINGRVVLHWPDQANVITPKQTHNRVVSQKSVMVRPGRGFFVPDSHEETVVIPGDLKGSMLMFLERFHGISERSVYNDIHGYIRHQRPNRTRYVAEFRETLGTSCDSESADLRHYMAANIERVTRVTVRYYCHQERMDYADGNGSVFALSFLDETGAMTSRRVALQPDEVIELLTHCIENGDGGIELRDAYCWRGGAFLFQGATELAKADFERALELDGEMAEAHHGWAHLHWRQGSADRAMAHLEEALRLDPEFKPALIDRGNALREGGLLDDAVRDFDVVLVGTRVTSMYTWFRDGHFFRAVAGCIQREWDAAEADFVRARQGGLRVASSFRSVFGGIERFEGEYDIMVPSSIKTQLYFCEDD
ncbi:MAG: FRG domain-containing protein [Rhodospirillaceae bacterium]|nr:FRG domain-containing protein [Rhodospirillaceae bacterium]